MSGGDGVRPCVAQPAPVLDKEVGGPGTLRAGGRATASSAPGQHDPRFFAVLLGLLGFSAAVALAAPDPAQGCAPAPTAPARAGPPFTGAVTGPTAPGADCAAQPTPSPGGVGVRKRPLPWIAAEPGQPLVAATPVKLTGSAVAITGLHFEGIVDLPTAGGSLKALKLTVDHAVVDDFVLRSAGPQGRTVRLSADRLTVQGDVAFYARHFTGKLLGIEITLTPDLPIPDGIPITSPRPITFTDLAIDLAFVTSAMLAARPTLKLTVD